MNYNIPKRGELEKVIELVRCYSFPEFYDTANVEWELHHLLVGQLRTIIAEKAESLADAFMSSLPEIRRLLHTDVEAAMTNDPAVESEMEVVFCYPLIEVMLYYRTAHQLVSLGVPMIPRLLTEIAHGKTGIDIHPKATIGDHFCIDHGTGVVIGATTIIGSNVVIYQGVTLGARNFHYDENGLPRNIPRHPIIGDNVTIYSNASVLGRITIGHDTIIGGNVWLTHDVPPHSRILQNKALYDQQ